MAAYKELYDAYFTEINNICEMLGKYVSVYRTLIDGASALNNIAFSKKSDIKKALKRANTMGDIIDELIDAIGEVDFCYLDYLQSKSAYIAHNVPKSSVFSELGSGLFLAGQFNTINNMPDIYKNVFKNGFNGFGKNSNNGGNNGGNNQGNNGQGNNTETPAAEPSNNEADDIKYQGENENNNAGQNSDEIVYKDNNENDTYDNENIESNDDISQSYDNSDYDE
ncbi:MAG: hypothetical protein SPJ62_14200 [Inconstantimicrobium porci]|uniref:hypothetical protein n=1 Tax=Inconstantimicrobium porci TaxID=2652291 RepID=UPI002A918843|nr:hypothetical protein [Inconstantimicrobium porci]MDY5913121.1 hypothetical protein [Inconstantimicrobium porci]